MAQHRLGRLEEARTTRDRLRALIQTPLHKSDWMNTEEASEMERLLGAGNR
jgi:hypothetical protein